MFCRNCGSKMIKLKTDSSQVSESLCPNSSCRTLVHTVMGDMQPDKVSVQELSDTEYKESFKRVVRQQWRHQR